MRQGRLGGFVAVILLGMLASGTAEAVRPDPPVGNWAAPSTWTPPAAATTAKTGVKTGLVTLYPPLPFIPLTPCRLADTRAGSGFPAGYGPPSIAGGGTQRTFTITGQCGIPSAAKAVSFNFAVWGPPTRGDLRVFPAGGGTPLVSTLNWESGILALANAAVVPLGTGGAITLQVDGPGTVDIFFDVNGYYSPDVSSASGSSFSIASNASYTAAIYGHSTGTYGYGVYGKGFIGSYGTGVFGVQGWGSSEGVYGTGGDNGVYGSSSAGNGVRGDASGVSGYGVWGINNSGGGVGIHGESAGIGVEGITASTSAGATGVRGVDGSGAPPGWSAFISSSSGTAGLSTGGVGVLAVTQFGGTGIGAWATRLNNVGPPYEPTSSAIFAEAGSTAASFYGTVNIYNHTWSTGSNSGNLWVQGSVSKGSGSFKIDHPLDPENMYLYHSFVESPDMMNVYNGVIELGPDGSAVVKLPRYFEALNRDFRYQLTALGVAQPDLHVALEIADNEFVVAGGRPNARVSWQVTGIRKDPFAEAHRIIPEVEKETEKRGLYLHADEYRQPPEKSIGAHAMEIERAREKAEADRRGGGHEQKN